SLHRAVDAALNIIAFRDIGAYKLRSAPQPLCVCASCRFTDIGDDYATAGGNDHFRRRCTETRRATTYEDGASVQLHRAILSRRVQKKGRRSLTAGPNLNTNREERTRKREGRQTTSLCTTSATSCFFLPPPRPWI